MSEIPVTVSAMNTTRHPLPQDVAGKLSAALKYKEEGTVHFKAGNFKKAIASYAKVTAFTRFRSRTSFDYTVLFRSNLTIQYLMI